MEIAAHLFCVSLILGLTAIDGAGSDAPRRGVHYTFGEQTLLVSGKIGAQGGSLRAALPPPHTGEVLIEIAPGALERVADIAVSLDHGSFAPRAGVWSGICVLLTATGVVSFAQPVRLTVPFKPQGRQMLIGYIVEKDGSIDAVDFGPSDPQAGTATFVTLRPGWYTWIATKY
jgi:hypothetical protein